MQLPIGPQRVCARAHTHTPTYTRAHARRLSVTRRKRPSGASSDLHNSTRSFPFSGPLSDEFITFQKHSSRRLGLGPWPWWAHLSFVPRCARVSSSTWQFAKPSMQKWEKGMKGQPVGRLAGCALTVPEGMQHCCWHCAVCGRSTLCSPVPSPSRRHITDGFPCTQRLLCRVAFPLGPLLIISCCTLFRLAADSNCSDGRPGHVHTDGNSLPSPPFSLPSFHFLCLARDFVPLGTAGLPAGSLPWPRLLARPVSNGWVASCMDWGCAYAGTNTSSLWGPRPCRPCARRVGIVASHAPLFFSLSRVCVALPSRCWKLPCYSVGGGRTRGSQHWWIRGSGNSWLGRCALERTTCFLHVPFLCAPHHAHYLIASAIG
ncbi:hypothetical protein BS50DRAFT_361143 [Corynespora cassiicola Philippines]|uniref:Uncharacterized protein n=1 Tax=Corynespora cassiicola Philippines TaxID=1448308 RepID=A0A2T2NSB7_CORCC|nr:hypothetical protein BS50DRAFT_361143 [Corynespora cassiicola Philippines]